MTIDIVGSGPNGGNILGLKNFISARRSSLETQLAPFGCYLSVEDLSPSEPTLLMFPNSASAILFFNLPAYWYNEKYTVEVIDMLGRVVILYDEVPTSPNSSVEISALTPSVYLLQITNGTGMRYTSRFWRSAE